MWTYKSIVIKLFKLFISTYLLFFISIQTPLGGITIDRFLILMLFIIILVTFKHRFTLFSSSIFFFIIYVTFNKLFYLDELLPKYFMFLICFLALYVSYRAGKLDYDFYKYFILSFLIIFTISIYSISSFLSTGFVPSEFTFLNSIPYIRSVNYEHMAIVNESYLFPRLSLPYPTPPQLSIVLALYSFYFLNRFLLYKSMLAKTLFICSVSLMLATISRSGIISFLLTAIIYYSIQSRSSFFTKYFKLIFFALILFFVIGIFNKDLYIILIDRFFTSSIEDFTSGHASARLYGLELFFDGTIFQMLFGHGIGNFVGIHAHMTTITFLVEIGLIGLLLFIFLFYQRLVVCYKFCKKYPNNSKHHFFELMILFLVFFGMALYEFTYVIPVYIFMGLAAGNSYNESKQLNLND